jgi:hypothetical protein
MRVIGRITLGLLLAFAGSEFSFGQTDQAKQNQSAARDLKDAGKATGRAAKKTGKAVGKGTKKVANKAAAKTEEGAAKVKDKTRP